MSILDRFTDYTNELCYDEGTGNVTDCRGKVVIGGSNDHVTVYRGGEMAVQGRPVALEEHGGTPSLIVEGEQYTGYETYKGYFAVIGYKPPLEVDGPLPEEQYG